VTSENHLPDIGPKADIQAITFLTSNPNPTATSRMICVASFQRALSWRVPFVEIVAWRRQH
jgi:hypothetical protein